MNRDSASEVTAAAPTAAWRIRVPVRAAAAVIAGLAMVLNSPPANWWWFHWFSFLPMFWALRAEDRFRRNALLGYLCGWVAVFALFSWLIETIVRFSNLPWVLALFIHVAFATAFAVPYAIVFGAVHGFRKRLGAWWVVLLPALEVCAEAFYPELFPYHHGNTQYRTRWLWQITSVVGVNGVSFLLFFSNSVLAEFIYRHREGRAPPWKAVLAFAATLAAALGFGAWRYPRIHARIGRAPVLRATILQQDVTMEERLQSPPAEGLASWIRLTRQIEDQHPDLVVWPEGSVPLNPDSDRTYRVLGGRSPKRFFGMMSRLGHYDLFMGGGTAESYVDPTTGKRAWRDYNSAYLFNRKGEVAGRYDKMVPLPFGEYIPFSDTFPWLNHIVEGPGDFRKGKTPTIFHATHADGTPYTFSAPICYEAILPGQMWKLSRADLFVNITNDAWFGDTAGPHQHAMLAVAQAMQLGRPMLRIAYTGVSLVAYPDGTIEDETQPFQEVAKVVSLHVAPVKTLFSEGGWLFPWVCAAGVLGAWIAARKRKVP